MSKDEFKKFLAEALNISATNLNDDTSISQDFGVDSLGILRLVSVVENKYNIEIDENHIDLLDNFSYAYKYINALIEER